MTNSLVAFALVAEEYERSGDPIRGLVPLFRPILEPLSGQPFQPDFFAEEFTRRYGLVMTPFVASALTESLEAVGLLRRTHQKGADAFIVSQEMLPEQQNVLDESRVEETASYFEKWAAKELERLGVANDGLGLKDALLSRLARPEFASVFLEQGATRDSKRIKRLLGKGDLAPIQGGDQVLDYLVARFLLTASETAPEVFDTLSSIAFGALIADAVAGLAAPGASEMPDPPLRVVIDGPLILDALDLNTPAHFEYSQGLLEILGKSGVRLATFDHVIDEVRDSIKSVLKAHSAGSAYGPLGQRLRSSPGLSIKASNVVDTLEERVGELGIDILRGEIYERADFKKYFDDEAFDRMRNAIGDVHHQLERRIRDTQSVAGVVRLKRENRRPSSVFRSGTLFLTRNSALVKKVNHVLSIGRSDPDPRFTVVSDGQLASVIWFSLGMKDGYSQLSKARLIANCSAAIVPQREVIVRISQLLEETDPALKEEFEVLMRDKRASLCPMRATAGIADVVNVDLSLSVLEEMRAENAAPLLEDAQRKLELEREELARMQAELDQSKEANAILQGGIGHVETSFNEQLAQIGIRLDGERATRRRMLKQLEGRYRELVSDVDRLNKMILVRKGRVRGFLRFFWIIACVVAIWLSIFLDSERSHWWKVGIFLLVVSTIGYFSGKVEGVLDRVGELFCKGMKDKLSERQAELDRCAQLIEEAGADHG